MLSRAGFGGACYSSGPPSWRTLVPSRFSSGERKSGTPDPRLVRTAARGVPPQGFADWH